MPPSRFSVLGSRFSVLSSRFSVLSSQFSVHPSPFTSHLSSRISSSPPGRGHADAGGEVGRHRRGEGDSGRRRLVSRDRQTPGFARTTTHGAASPSPSPRLTTPEARQAQHFPLPGGEGGVPTGSPRGSGLRCLRGDVSVGSGSQTKDLAPFRLPLSFPADPPGGGKGASTPPARLRVTSAGRARVPALRATVHGSLVLGVPSASSLTLTLPPFTSYPFTPHLSSLTL
jgi:hypothetical protein